MNFMEELRSRNLKELAQKYHVQVEGDKADFQRKARILQSFWREQQGYDSGLHRSFPIGSRLAMPWAKESLSNFLTDNIRQVVREDVLNPAGDEGRLIEPNRLFGNLLSSQPLCFNLFAELALNLGLASRLVSRLTDGRFASVQEIRFEYSPGRSDPKYTSARSAFDVFFLCQTPRGDPAFLGMEVKYHENLQNKAGRHRARYDEVAEHMGCFKPSAMSQLREKPLQQIWCDHLLVGALQTHDGFDDAAFVFLFPCDNTYCEVAVANYVSCLSDTSSFIAWTLEEVVSALKQESSEDWIDLFNSRYLDFSQLPLS